MNVTTTNWVCPICRKSVNSQGNEFCSSRAVALHIAGKIKWDSSHRSWALNKAGDRIDDYRKRTINELADILEWHVEESYKEIEQNTEQVKPTGQAFEYMISIERGIHEFIRSVLQQSYGETDWWLKGIPVQIRVDCAKRREEDSCKADAYSYTYLIDLKTIIDKNWGIFEPFIRRIRIQKSEFLNDMGRLNDLRNRIAHPNRASITGEELSFIRSFAELAREL